MLVVCAVLLGTCPLFAKTLSVECTGERSDSSVELVAEIENKNAAPEIEVFFVDGLEPSRIRDISEKPVYKDGKFALKIQYGPRLYSSVELSVESCDDDFEATGEGVLRKHVGGFAGESKEPLECICSFLD